MVTGFEGVGLKALIDSLVALFNRSKEKRITAEGKRALEEAMRELLLAATGLEQRGHDADEVRSRSVICQTLNRV